MPFAIPSLSDLVTRARQAFRTYLPGSDAWVWPNNINPSSKVIGAAIFEVFGFADYICKQKFAITADGENLDLHGAEYGMARRPATPAQGNIAVVTPDALSISPGAIFQRSDGILYSSLSTASIGGAGTLSIAAVATSDGKTTSAIEGTPLEMVSGVSGAGLSGATASVDTGGIVGGTDVEPDGEPYTTDLSTWRGRILFRKRNPPFGGNAADYVQWASAVSGVTRVFVERVWSGAGTVRVFPLMDDFYPSSNGIANSGDIQRVVDYLATVQPGDAVVTVQAPAAVTVNITITGLTPNTTATQEGVLAELRAAFRRLSTVAGADTPHPSMPYLAVPTSFAVGWIYSAVMNAVGVKRGVVTIPAADVALTGGQLPVLGTVTFA